MGGINIVNANAPLCDRNTVLSDILISRSGRLWNLNGRSIRGRDSDIQHASEKFAREKANKVACAKLSSWVAQPWDESETGTSSAGFTPQRASRQSRPCSSLLQGRNDVQLPKTQFIMFATQGEPVIDQVWTLSWGWR